MPSNHTHHQRPERSHCIRSITNHRTTLFQSMANSRTWKPPTFKALLFVFFCLFVCHRTRAAFSRHLPTPHKCKHASHFTLFSLPFLPFSWKRGNGCLVQTGLTLFLPHWWSEVFPPTHYFYVKRIISFFPLRVSNELFLSFKASDFKVRTNMVPNLQTLSYLIYSSFSIAPLLINHNTSDKESNKFFCREAD